MNADLLTAFWFCLGLYFVGRGIATVDSLIRSGGEE